MPHHTLSLPPRGSQTMAELVPTLVHMLLRCHTAAAGWMSGQVGHAWHLFRVINPHLRTPQVRPNFEQIYPVRHDPLRSFLDRRSISLSKLSAHECYLRYAVRSVRHFCSPRRLRSCGIMRATAHQQTQVRSG